MSGIFSPLFQVHRLNDDGMKAAGLIAESFDGLLLYLSKLCPDGREFSIVKTKLEEACFFAKKAMANLPEHQEGFKAVVLHVSVQQPPPAELIDAVKEFQAEAEAASGAADMTAPPSNPTPPSVESAPSTAGETSSSSGAESAPSPVTCDSCGMPLNPDAHNGGHGAQCPNGPEKPAEPEILTDADIPF